MWSVCIYWTMARVLDDLAIGKRNDCYNYCISGSGSRCEFVRNIAAANRHTEPRRRFMPWWCHIIDVCHQSEIGFLGCFPLFSATYSSHFLDTSSIAACVAPTPLHLVTLSLGQFSCHDAVADISFQAPLTAHTQAHAQLLLTSAAPRRLRGEEFPPSWILETCGQATHVKDLRIRTRGTVQYSNRVALTPSYSYCTYVRVVRNHESLKHSGKDSGDLSTISVWPIIGFCLSTKSIAIAFLA